MASIGEPRTFIAEEDATSPEQQPQPLFLSIIIPCLNEQANLPGLLDSIHGSCAELQYEVIVADNGSTDSSVEIAERSGARVFVFPNATVGEARNMAAAYARGEVLAFLDADMLLPADWGLCVAKLMSVRVAGRCILGSRPIAPPHESWIANAWYGKAGRKIGHTGPRHIGSGHMLISATTFSELGGFAAGLRTGEDFDLCARAISAGIVLKEVPNLEVVHRGVPQSIIDLLRRENWHGRSDFERIGSILKSRPALASLIFTALHFLVIATMILGHLPTTTAAVAAIAALCAVGAYSRRGLTRIDDFLRLSFLFYFYYWGRAVSILQSEPRKGWRT